MPLISTVSIQDVTGDMEKEYLRFLQVIGEVPAHYRLVSASPGLLQARRALEDYYGNHPRFSFRLICFIRLLAAQSLKFEACKIYNLRLLKTKEGLLDKWATIPLKDPSQTPLAENEKALLLFSSKALKSPKSVQPRDMDALRALGWNDGDILDAVHLSAMVKTEKELYILFRVDRK
ncbi:MAG: hypothetical protein JEZ02_03130 [Desulfatibacillum sp.]|nr:hypothetical protein [Desulfatibacillum sp.]